jgi:cell division protein FtsZ
MVGAKRVLFNITGDSKIYIRDIDEAARIINDASGRDVNLLWGFVLDPDMEDMARITIFAADFDAPFEHTQEDTANSVEENINEVNA